MRNCITADVLRVQKKKSFFIMIFFILAFLVLFAVLSGLHLIKGNAGENFLSMSGALFSFNSLFIGIPVFNSVFSDDFKSRSMQTSIGFGISRTKMLLARFFEVVIIISEAYVVFTLIVIGVGKGLGATWGNVGDSLENLWLTGLLNLCYMAIAMIFVYLSSNGTLGLVLYILLSLNAFTLILTAVDAIPFLKKHDIKLSKITVDGMFASAFTGDLEMGKKVMWGIMMIVCYLIFPLFISVQIFKKKELDF